MPDDLVVCFTFSDQSIIGGAAVAKSAHSQRVKPDGSAGLRIWPVPMRVEFSEKDKLEAARGYARPSFNGFLSRFSQADLAKYWGDVETIYFPYYSFEETLAAFGDRAGERNTLLAAMERVTGYLTDGRIAMTVAPSEADRTRILARFARSELKRQTQPDISSTSRPSSYNFDVALSYAKEDELLVGRFARRLEERGLRVFHGKWDELVEWGVNLDVELDELFRTKARFCVVFLSRAYMASFWTHNELQPAYNKAVQDTNPDVK